MGRRVASKFYLLQINDSVLLLSEPMKMEEATVCTWCGQYLDKFSSSSRSDYPASPSLTIECSAYYALDYGVSVLRVTLQSDGCYLQSRNCLLRGMLLPHKASNFPSSSRQLDRNKMGEMPWRGLRHVRMLTGHNNILQINSATVKLY